MRARRRQASEEARPFRDHAQAKEQEAAQWREELAKRKKTRNAKAVAEAEECIGILSKSLGPAGRASQTRALHFAGQPQAVGVGGVKYISLLSKEARALNAKAEDIENAAFDLKAVNPHKKPEIDTRTPEDLLDIIEQKGREIQEALRVLRKP